jgi:hypothetical protein
LGFVALVEVEDVDDGLGCDGDEAFVGAGDTLGFDVDDVAVGVGAEINGVDGFIPLFNAFA